MASSQSNFRVQKNLPFQKKKGRGGLCLFVKTACGRFSECSLCHNAPQSHTSDCPSPTALLLNIRLPADPQCLSEKKNKKKTRQPSAVEAAVCARLSEPPRSRKAPENGSGVAKVEQSSAIKSSSPQKWVHLKSKQKGGGHALDSTRSAYGGAKCARGSSDGGREMAF